MGNCPPTPHEIRSLPVATRIADLWIGLRQVGPGFDWAAVRLNRTPGYKWMLGTATQYVQVMGDEVLADAIGVYGS